MRAGTLKRRKPLKRGKPKKPPKSALQKRKDNPNSKLWRDKGDRLWSERVRERDGWRCRVCGLGRDDCVRVEAHHIINRECRLFRHDLRNGMTLCTRHHRWGNASASVTDISPHGTPAAFHHWFEEYEPDLWEWVGANRNKLATEPITWKESHERLSEGEGNA